LITPAECQAGCRGQLRERHCDDGRPAVHAAEHRARPCRRGALPRQVGRPQPGGRRHAV